jgi:hypothetical protein
MPAAARTTWPAPTTQMARPAQTRTTRPALPAAAHARRRWQGGQTQGVRSDASSGSVWGGRRRAASARRHWLAVGRWSSRCRCAAGRAGPVTVLPAPLDGRPVPRETATDEAAVRWIEGAPLSNKHQPRRTDRMCAAGAEHRSYAPSDSRFVRSFCSEMVQTSRTGSPSSLPTAKALTVVGPGVVPTSNHCSSRELASAVRNCCNGVAGWTRRNAGSSAEHSRQREVAARADERADGDREHPGPEDLRRHPPADGTDPLARAHAHDR